MFRAWGASPSGTWGVRLGGWDDARNEVQLPGHDASSLARSLRIAGGIGVHLRHTARIARASDNEATTEKVMQNFESGLTTPWISTSQKRGSSSASDGDGPWG